MPGDGGHLKKHVAHRLLFENRRVVHRIDAPNGPLSRVDEEENVQDTRQSRAGIAGLVGDQIDHGRVDRISRRVRDWKMLACALDQLNELAQGVLLHVDVGGGYSLQGRGIRLHRVMPHPDRHHVQEVPDEIHQRRHVAQGKRNRNVEEWISAQSAQDYGEVCAGHRHGGGPSCDLRQRREQLVVIKAALRGSDRHPHSRTRLVDWDIQDHGRGGRNHLLVPVREIAIQMSLSFERLLPIRKVYELHRKFRQR
mmetsp:Transcript_47895/g.137437  ORF Transcript_47895/g.137437 Transcript_47895/m.137437 type:complete len:253 (-) Transcript_47895:1266-2024(-)